MDEPTVQESIPSFNAQPHQSHEVTKNITPNIIEPCLDCTTKYLTLHPYPLWDQCLDSLQSHWMVVNPGILYPSNGLKLAIYITTKSNGTHEPDGRDGPQVNHIDDSPPWLNRPVLTFCEATLANVAACSFLLCLFQAYTSCRCLFIITPFAFSA